MRYPFVLSTCREDKYRPIGENGGAAGTPGEMNQTLVGAQVRESCFAKQAGKLYVQTAEGTPGKINQTSVAARAATQGEKMQEAVKEAPTK